LGFLAEKRQQNTQMDWDDKPGNARHKGAMVQRHKDLILSLAECTVGPGLKSLYTVFPSKGTTEIAAQRHFVVYRSSHATRRDAHSVLGPALQSWFCRGKAQRHKGTKAQKSDLIVGRMQGWTNVL